ncbi:AAA family ATPase [Flavobacterium sp.]|uniref:McrB family protein n=1 Tax=Flavobacterium sp. TaxID=239 RepID=UPI002488E488|nr:AAA family ATPase [Flavobacterium sp.]MDI1318089.1 AAA family ATPase [Flavobacterium sp.]
MINYKDYEEEVFNWLISKNANDFTFTFSLRQKGSKGAETDYFIGTEKSNYFSTTFWYLPVAFPGSSGDCMGLVFEYTKTGYHYFFEFTQTKKPHDNQNKAALELVQKLQNVLEKPIGFQRQPTAENKMFTLRTKTIKDSYQNVDEMFVDIQKDMEIIFPIVDESISVIKKEYPDFKANRLSVEEFEVMIQKFDARIKRFENSDISHLEDEIESITETKDIINNGISTRFPLNQILYGPPGTGKTYNTVLEAAKIVTGNENINYDDALQVFNANLNNQIEFITFHQNYSYEDFIQGLRPDTENGNALTFEKKDGVFKRIADRAYLNLKASENNQIAKQSFKEVLNNYIKSFIEGEVDEIEVKMIKMSYFFTDISEKNISFRKNSGGTGHTLSLTTLAKMYNEESTGEIQGLSSYYEPLLKLLLEKGKANQNSKIIKQNYVIIIDEINRANISRVFGELITLIEEDKRSHGKIPMRVTLPSGDSFIVPSNLYIIGTMNTADKSIALLDIALRRRFEFVPMYPDVTIDAVNDKEILSAINKAILDRKNHDFTIGHAYFMGDDYSRVKTINNKVIPLLLEYFMNDEKEVKVILQSAQLTVDGWPLKLIS